jgi:hypothetical protein
MFIEQTQLIEENSSCFKENENTSILGQRQNFLPYMRESEAFAGR